MISMKKVFMMVFIVVISFSLRISAEVTQTSSPTTVPTTGCPTGPSAPTGGHSAGADEAKAAAEATAAGAASAADGAAKAAEGDAAAGKTAADGADEKNGEMKNAQLGPLSSSADPKAKSAASDAKDKKDKAADSKNFFSSFMNSIANALTGKTDSAKATNSDKKKSEKSDAAGDPVLVTTGKYISAETDIECGDFTLRRQYIASSGDKGSLGSYWQLSTDTRIIRGISYVDRQLFQQAKDSVRELYDLYAQSSALASAYGPASDAARANDANYNSSVCSSFASGLQSLYNSISQYVTDANNASANAAAQRNAALAASSAASTAARSVLSTVADSSAASAASSAAAAANSAASAASSAARAAEISKSAGTTLTEQSSFAQAQIDALNASQQALQASTQAYLNQTTSEIYGMYLSASQTLAAKQSEFDRAETLRKLNRYADEIDDSSKCGMTGNESLVLIDDTGSPITFLYQNGGKWLPDDAVLARTDYITSNDGLGADSSSGFKLHTKNGVVKSYNSNGILVAVSDRNGNAVEYNRISGGYRLASVKGNGRTFLFTYENGLIKKITCPENQSVVYSYSGGVLSSVTDVEGDSIGYQYDDGRLVKITKPDGSFVSLTYGFTGPNNTRLASATMNEEGASETFDYDIANKVTEHTNQNGVVTKYWYDASYRTVREEHADGTVIQNQYNATSGNLDSKSVNGNATTYTYDARGNLSSARYADGSSESWEWNAFDEKTLYRDRDGVESIWNYDEQGNCVSISVGGVPSFMGSYDQKGQLVSCQRWNHAAENYTYDENGNLRTKTVSSGGTSITERWEYDALGRVTARTDGAGRVWSYVYDKKSVTERDPNGLELKYFYNNRKDLVRLLETATATGQTHETTFAYDRRHLPISIKDGAGVEKKYTYRDDGQVATVTTGKWQQAFQYDSAGRLSESKHTMDGSGEVYSDRYAYALTANGEERTVTSGEGIGELYRYDLWNRVVSVTDSMENVSERILSPEGRVRKEQSKFCGWFAYSYDDQGRLTGVGKEGKASVCVTYNPDGSVASKTDRNGVATTYTYDELGRQTAETTTSGTKRYSYDVVGRMIRMSFETGAQGGNEQSATFTAWAYAPDGRTITVSEGDLYTTTLTLDAWGNTLSKTDGTGNIFRWTYDGAGNLATSIDAYGRVTAYTWNAIGKIDTITYPDSTVERYEYSALGDVNRIIDEAGVKWEGSYDSAGRLVHETGRPGIDRTYEYDALNRVTSVSSGGEVTERYAYSDRGRRVSVTDGAGVNYTYEKDEFGQEVSETNRIGDSQRFEYDAEGSVTRKVKFSGKAIGFEYSGPTTTTRYADGTSSIIVRDCAGRVTRATDTTGTITYSYDAGGRLVRQYDQKAAEETTYTYDRAGQRTHMTSGNRDVQYQYGKNGELTSVIDRGARLSVAFTYDLMGREISRTYGNCVRQETTYDKIGRTIMIREISPGRELTRAEGYVYDNLGRRACTVTEKGAVTEYEYDAQSRVSAVVYPYSDALLSSFKTESEQAGVPITDYQAQYEQVPVDRMDALRTVLDLMAPSRSSILQTSQKVWRESYSYDKKGNRVLKQTPVGSLTYAYDAENRLVGKNIVVYSYDKDGNLLSEQGRVTTAKYDYTETDRMKTSTVVNTIAKQCTITYYAYDAFGRRTLVKDEGGSTMRTLYDAQSFEQIRSGPSFNDESFTSNYSRGVLIQGNGTGERYRFIDDGNTDGRYRYTGDDDIAVVAKRYTGVQVPLVVGGAEVAMNRAGSTQAGATTRGGVSYLGNDVLGSMRSATNESGSLEAVFEYDAFGTPVSGDFNTGLNAGYTGKPYDSVTGLYDYGYRDYSPQSVRFTTVDPIRDGSNWFAYVNNDPVNFTDPFGLTASDIEQGRINSYISQNRENLKEAIDKSINDPKNQPEDGGDITHCNNVPPQVLKQLNMDSASIMNKDSNGKTVPTRATDMLNNLSTSSDWHTIDGKQAQTLANQGTPVIAGAQGHVGVVYPGNYSENKGPQIGQAGTRNGVFSAGGSGFVSSPNYYAPNKW